MHSVTELFSAMAHQIFPTELFLSLLTKTEQKKPKKGLFLKIAAIAFAVYLLISLISMQSSINHKKNELDDLRQQYTESLIRNEELQKTLDSYGTDEFIEEQAREKLVKSAMKRYIL